MKRSSKFGIAGIIGVVLIVAVVWQVSKDYRFNTYIDPANRFSIKYPASWVINDDSGGADVLLASKLENDLDFFQENVNVVVQDLSEDPKSLTDYTNLAIMQMQVVFKENFMVDESSPTGTLSGKPAHKLIFVGKGPPVQPNIKYYILWTVVKRKTAYQVTYTAIESEYDKYIDKVFIMMNSFKILKEEV